MENKNPNQLLGIMLVFRREKEIDEHKRNDRMCVILYSDTKSKIPL